jgi:penicillin V acylase-like amidase (Ntn superfamily)
MKSTVIPVSCFLFSLVMLFQNNPIDANSEIFLNKGDQFYFSARTFDQQDGNGYLRFTPEGEKQKSLYIPDDCLPVEWVSQYASLTFNTVVPISKTSDDGFYEVGIDGINVRGLKVGAFSFDHPPINMKPSQKALDTTTAIHYILDNFKDVEETISFFNDNEITFTSPPDKIRNFSQQLFLHDSTGTSAIIEFQEERPRITKNPAVPVLTNSSYTNSLKSLDNYTSFGGKEPLPGGEDPLSRFVRGASTWNLLPKPTNSTNALNISLAALAPISIPPGHPDRCTYWSIVTDIQQKKVFFKTFNSPQLASIDLSQVAASCSVSSDIDLLRSDLKGDLSNFFDKTQNFNPAGVPQKPDYTDPTCWALAPEQSDRTFPVDVFFVHPTTHFFPNTWNESIESSRKNLQLKSSLGNQARVFSKYCNVFAPHYRDAQIKVLNVPKDQQNQVLEIAYSDVESAFHYYLNNLNQGRPFILAGHSQGSNLLLWLLERKFDNPQLQEKLIASYLIGWSITEEDLSQFPFLKVSNAPDQTGCVISYNTQTTDPEYSIVQPKAIAVNPLTMTITSQAIGKDKNLGAVFFQGDQKVEIPNFTGAQTIDGALIIPEIKETNLVKTGSKGFYHGYDYNIFYRNLEKNIPLRIQAFLNEKQQ